MMNGHCCSSRVVVVVLVNIEKRARILLSFLFLDRPLAIIAVVGNNTSG